jgi:hypothetical protein
MPRPNGLEPLVKPETPVITSARLGTQSGLAVRARVNVLPSRTSRSRAGVSI